MLSPRRSQAGGILLHRFAALICRRSRYKGWPRPKILEAAVRLLASLGSPGTFYVFLHIYRCIMRLWHAPVRSRKPLNCFCREVVLPYGLGFTVIVLSRNTSSLLSYRHRCIYPSKPTGWIPTVFVFLANYLLFKREKVIFVSTGYLFLQTLANYLL